MKEKKYLKKDILDALKLSKLSSKVHHGQRCLVSKMTATLCMLSNLLIYYCLHELTAAPASQHCNDCASFILY